MDTENTDTPYEAVLADLRRRRSTLDATIQALEQIMRGDGAPPLADTPLGSGMQGEESKIRPDSFFNMSIPDAVKKYLRMKKRPQSTRQITDALEEGGMISSAKNFYSTVYTGLRRLRDSGEVVQLESKEWALAKWYPNRPKPATQKDSEKSENGGEAGESGEAEQEPDVGEAEE